MRVLPSESQPRKEDRAARRARKEEARAAHRACHVAKTAACQDRLAALQQRQEPGWWREDARGQGQVAVIGEGGVAKSKDSERRPSVDADEARQVKKSRQQLRREASAAAREEADAALALARKDAQLRAEDLLRRTVAQDMLNIR